LAQKERSKMLALDKGQNVDFTFFFTLDNLLYDPIEQDVPKDIIATVYRGDTSSGPVVDGPYSFLLTPSEVENFPFFEKSNKIFTFKYKVPPNLFEGVYTVFIQTSTDFISLSKSFQFSVKKNATILQASVAGASKISIVNYKPSYKQIDKGNTGTVLLIGHSDGLGINEVFRPKTVQHAIDVLGADLSSPLLRGFFDAYSCGARDIILCCAAPMSEYVSEVSLRNIATNIFEPDAAEPNLMTFYEKYFQRLEKTYDLVSSLEYVDLIVPLETSFIQTGNVNFLEQLTFHCARFFEDTNYIQLGVIGSRSFNPRNIDIEEILNSQDIINKFTILSADNQIVSDYGRYVIPVYGEMIFRHPQLAESYSSSAAAAVAAMLSNQELNTGMSRQRIPGALSMLGPDLTQEQADLLNFARVNYIYRGRKARQAIPNEVYISNDNTLANDNSVFKKVSQIRIVAAVVNEVNSYRSTAIGKFGFEKTVASFTSFLNSMKNSGIIRDYTLNTEVDLLVSGKIYFSVELISSLTLEVIELSLAAGPSA
jgi:hypothetical protein